MTEVMASLFVEVRPCKATLRLIHDGNFLIIASTAGAYSLQLMLQRVVADGITRSSLEALYDSRSFKFDIALHGL